MIGLRNCLIQMNTTFLENSELLEFINENFPIANNAINYNELLDENLNKFYLESF